LVSDMTLILSLPPFTKLASFKAVLEFLVPMILFENCL